MQVSLKVKELNASNSMHLKRRERSLRWRNLDRRDYTIDRSTDTAKQD